MSRDKDFYVGAYGNFRDDILAAVRLETYGTDLGQNSWTTVDEYDRFCSLLGVGRQSSVLETASGSGGPALYLAEKRGCRVTGVDINEEGVDNAKRLAAERGLNNASFQKADVSKRLPFEDSEFDAIICIDAANHFPDRSHVLGEWARVLRPGGRLLFTDPVVITGPVTNKELFDRSSIGVFVFMPPETTEKIIKLVGLKLIKREDVTSNIELTSRRWYRARAKRRDSLLNIETEGDFEHLQTFLATVHKLASERRLSRFAFLVEK